LLHASKESTADVHTADEFINMSLSTNSHTMRKRHFKCCGKESTTSPEVWFTHMKEDCDGTLNPELLEHAQAAADKHFTAKAKQTLQHASAT
jgi:hypothetical protein